MKRILIAAGLAAMLMGAAPAMASPVAASPVAAAAQDMRDGNRDERRDDRRMDRRDDRRMDRRDNRRDDRRWRSNGRHLGWRNNCHNVRRHHRWVRVCNRR